MAVTKFDDEVEKLARQLEAARAKQEEERVRLKAEFIAKIHAGMAEHNITPEELGLRRGAVQAPVVTYRDPVTGDTWSGKGKAPSWLPSDASERAALEVKERATEPAVSAGPKKTRVARGNAGATGEPDGVTQPNSAGVRVSASSSTQSTTLAPDAVPPASHAATSGDQAVQAGGSAVAA